MSAAAKQITPDRATQELWQIARAGDPSALADVLARGADVNACDRFGMTPLMIAAYHGRSGMVTSLLEHGADLNATDRDGFTAAKLAEHAGHEEIAKTLGGSNVKRSSRPRTPKLSPVVLAADETFEEFNEPESFAEVREPESSPAGRNGDVRTLSEPPEIWDLVHEERPAFQARSAFFAHVKWPTLVLTAVVVVVAAGVVFWFSKWRSSPALSTTAAPVAAKSSAKTALKPQPPSAKSKASVPDQRLADTSALTSPANATNDSLKPTESRASTSSSRQFVTKPRPQNRRSASRANYETVADGNVEVDSNSTAANRAKGAGRAAARKEPDRVESPPVPAKVNSTPKPKVIPWP